MSDLFINLHSFFYALFQHTIIKILLNFIISNKHKLYCKYLQEDAFWIKIVIGQIIPLINEIPQLE